MKIKKKLMVCAPKTMDVEKSSKSPLASPKTKPNFSS
jgi:hypothetical protein